MTETKAYRMQQGDINRENSVLIEGKERKFERTVFITYLTKAHN